MLDKANYAGIKFTGIATSKSFEVLKNLPPDELEETLQNIDKAQLQALMKHSKQMKKYGEEEVERLRQALYVAWISRFPLEAAEFDVGKAENPILKMTTGAKFAEAIRRSIDKLPEQGRKRIKELLTPEAIAMMVGFAIAYVVSQTTPIGWLADIIIAGLIAVTILMVGHEAIEIVKLMLRFSDKAANASSEKDLDEAADAFATAVSKVGIDIIMAILFHKVGKSTNLKPPRQRSPSLVEVLIPKGGKAKTTIVEPQTSGHLVTPEGTTFFEQFPSSAMMAEAKSATSPKGPLASGKGSPNKPSAGPAGAAQAKPPGQSLAAAEAVAKKKPPSPDQLLDEAKQLGGKQKGTSTPPATDPNVAAKATVLKQIEENRSLKAQIMEELRELGTKKHNYVDEEGRKLADLRNELVNQLVNVVKKEAEFGQKLSKLGVSLYERARGYSYSSEAGKHVTTRARGLDEVSGKKLKFPSIDHTVSIKEIVEMKGYNKLLERDQNTILSMVENLRMMESDLNSSKGNKRWADWDFGRKYYGEAAWKKIYKRKVRLDVRFFESLSLLYRNGSEAKV